MLGYIAITRSAATFATCEPCSNLTAGGNMTLCNVCSLTGASSDDTAAG